MEPFCGNIQKVVGKGSEMRKKNCALSWDNKVVRRNKSQAASAVQLYDPGLTSWRLAHRLATRMRIEEV